MTENKKDAPLAPDAVGGADMMYEGGGSVPHADVPHADDPPSASAVRGEDEPRRQAKGKSAGSTTFLAKLRRGWRSGAQSGELPLDRQSHFWKLTALWLLIALAGYAVWSTFGFGD